MRRHAGVVARSQLPVTAGDRCVVLPLDDLAATDPVLAGAKAANLARAARAGLPVLPGFVLTTDAAGVDTAREAWAALSRDGAQPLVVRSSSTVEDAESSSLAGQFRSVLDVRGWPQFAAAVAAVRESAVAVGRRLGAPAPMAVLVQPQLTCVCSGVLFGVDPVTGDRRHLVVEVVRGGPDALVSGTATAAMLVLGPHGRLHSGDPDARGLLPRSRRRQLAALARRAAHAFAGPQDIEWAYDRDGRLWLLQSRPVTAVPEPAPPRSPLLGPGPVAETFPAPLRGLEVDLWVDPLRRGVVEALRLTGAASARGVARSPVVTTVGGWVAADLVLLGVARPPHAWLRRLNPLPAARRLAAAWRTGRITAALPALVGDVAAEVDSALAGVPPLRELGDRELLGLLDRCRRALVVTSGYEVLAGMLLPPEDDPTSAAGIALRTLSQHRARGTDDATVLHAEPVVLALLAPRIGPPAELPAVPGDLAPPPALTELDVRDAMRLRSRWLQEVSARAATELGERLAAAGVLATPRAVASLTLPELATAVAQRTAPVDLPDRAARLPGPPLPTAFRLSTAGEVVAHRAAGALAGAARGAGGGRGAGRVVAPADVDPAVTDQVLVVRTLDPDLAPLLPHLAGLVSETGSVLSHLAILARELHVPTVVAMAGAVSTLRPGSVVVVDGATGEVSQAAP